MNRRIVIVGFMGCGKTAVAEALSAHLGGEMIDLDSFINDRERRSPAEIIQEDGEPAFRAIETRALRDVLDKTYACVIALGGGAWTSETNRALVAAHDCLSIWLDAPFDLCWKRIASSGTVRPLAPDRQSAQKLFESRRTSYQLAGIHVHATDERTPPAIASEILIKLSTLVTG